MQRNKLGNEREELVGGDQLVSHGNSEGLHWVRRGIVESAEDVVVEIGYLLIELVIHSRKYYSNHFMSKNLTAEGFEPSPFRTSA